MKLRRRSIKPKQGGPLIAFRDFSLLEVLITVAVILLAMVLLVSAFNRYYLEKGRQTADLQNLHLAYTAARLATMELDTFDGYYDPVSEELVRSRPASLGQSQSSTLLVEASDINPALSYTPPTVGKAIAVTIRDGQVSVRFGNTVGLTEPDGSILSIQTLLSNADTGRPVLFLSSGSLSGTFLNGDLVLPDSERYSLVKSQGFKMNMDLHSITLPACIVSVGEEAFAGCSTLSSVTLYNRTPNIGAHAFDKCPKLSDVYYVGTREEWKALRKDGWISAEGNDALWKADIHYEARP